MGPTNQRPTANWNQSCFRVHQIRDLWIVSCFSVICVFGSDIPEVKMNLSEFISTWLEHNLCSRCCIVSQFTTASSNYNQNWVCENTVEHCILWHWPSCLVWAVLVCFCELIIVCQYVAGRLYVKYWYWSLEYSAILIALPLCLIITSLKTAFLYGDEVFHLFCSFSH